MNTELVFVLVRPAVPENVGAAARALKAMGFRQLRIVASDAQRHKKARILAHGAGDVLDAATHFDNLPAALADCDLVIGTSAKERSGKRQSYSPGEVRGALQNKGASVRRAALVFGCEESGLSNAELEYCDLVSAIALAQPYPSLNLGQAVMLYAYELSALGGASAVAIPASGEWLSLKERLLTLLSALDYAPDDKLYRWARERLALLSAEDVGFMHLLLTRLQDKVLQEKVKNDNDNPAR